MNNLKVFSYGEQQVRTVLIDEEPWWVLGLVNASKTSGGLDEDEKMTVTQSYSHSGQRGGAQRMIVVNESGLYSVILRSDKPEAKAFKRWVTHEVLPSIRKTGAYAAPTWTPPNVVPVAVPVVPELPTDAMLKRAELLIRAAEHTALPPDEQVRLLNRAAMDLTGMGVKSPKTGVEQFSVPEDQRFPRTFTGAVSKEVEGDAREQI